LTEKRSALTEGAAEDTKERLKEDFEMLRQSTFDELFGVLRHFDNRFRRGFFRFSPAELDTLRLLPSGKSSDKPLVRRCEHTRPSLSGWGYFPAMESYRENGNLVIRAELPGVEPSEVNVTLTGDTLTVSGEKKHARETDENDVYFREISHGQFERSFKLPKGVKSEDVKATFQNGVLELSVAMPESDKPQDVRIEVGSANGKKKA
jgi:HSP20 family protein